MQLQDLNAFVAVASDRSFSKAAKRLHRTQPAISQAIRRLEDELGDHVAVQERECHHQRDGGQNRDDAFPGHSTIP